MSELGYLSKRYNRISRLTDDINKASIAIKKYTLKQEKDSGMKYPQLNLPEEIYVKSKDRLVKFLGSMIQLIENGASDSDITMLSENKAFKEQICGNIHLKNDIVVLLNKLKKNEVLSKFQFKLLDTLIGILDNERSHLFRKMRNISG